MNPPSKKKKVAYVGNFTAAHTTENHIAATLEDMGHEVTRIQEYHGNAEGFVGQVERHDLFLFTRTWNNLVTLDHLAQFKAMGIPTASFHLDLYVGLQREGGLDEDPFWRTDYVFSPDGDPRSAEVFNRKGINHHYLKPGVYKAECYLAEPDGASGNDVIFVGGGTPTGQNQQYGHPEWPYRGELLKWLQDTYGSHYTKYGHPQETVRNAALNQLYANSKVAVGDSTCLGFDHYGYTSDRLFESVGRGAFTVYPWIDGISNTCFKDGKEIVYYQYGDFAGLREKINYYVTHDEEREKIRLAGHERAKREHTYHDRLTEALGVVFGN